MVILKYELLKMRKTLDQYYTPTQAVRQMLDALDFSLHDAKILEPCSGDGAIANELIARGYNVHSNDIDKKFLCDSYLDMTLRKNWDVFTDVDWVITNPPFTEAPQMVPDALRIAKKGVIMLLRLSFLEPCKNRMEFLIKSPPNHLLVTPRISFTGAGTDRVTTSWFIWRKDCSVSSIEVLPR